MYRLLISIICLFYHSAILYISQYITPYISNTMKKQKLLKLLIYHFSIKTCLDYTKR